MSFEHLISIWKLNCFQMDLMQLQHFDRHFYDFNYITSLIIFFRSVELSESLLHEYRPVLQL